ncbi:NINE protein [Aurantibacillus circumpalustris]|uniref:NINE protein n=1 Tax=Aurantibacillus circumpalustris TaxID=3036359 RepID=UPI00295ABE58|nr:NINE protein [Aurantibacillus circumpalustris]
MRVKSILLLFCLIFSQELFCINKINSSSFIVLENKLSLSKDLNFDALDSYFTEIMDLNKNRPTPVLRFFHFKHNKNKKLTAAALAFPLPFGIVGLHRIYLGTAPYVPVVYIASFGGVLGLLPLIDFCFILLEKDTEKFVDNKKVFMWVN